MAGKAGRAGKSGKEVRQVRQVRQVLYLIHISEPDEKGRNRGCRLQTDKNKSDSNTHEH